MASLTLARVVEHHVTAIRAQDLRETG